MGSIVLLSAVTPELVPRGRFSWFDSIGVLFLLFIVEDALPIDDNISQLVFRPMAERFVDLSHFGFWIFREDLCVVVHQPEIYSNLNRITIGIAIEFILNVLDTDRVCNHLGIVGERHRIDGPSVRLRLGFPQKVIDESLDVCLPLLVLSDL